MFDAYTATIAIPSGQIADEVYLRAVRAQVKHPTGPVHLTVSPGGTGVGGLRLVLEEAGIPRHVVFAAHERDSDIAPTDSIADGSVLISTTTATRT